MKLTSPLALVLPLFLLACGGSAQEEEPHVVDSETCHTYCDAQDACGMNPSWCASNCRELGIAPYCAEEGAAYVSCMDSAELTTCQERVAIADCYELWWDLEDCLWPSDE